MASKVPHRIQGKDGRNRSGEEEMQLNRLFSSVFGAEDGRQAIQYLKNITMHTVVPPAASDATLWHMEGQRYIVALMLTRIEEGQNAQRSDGSDGKRASSTRRRKQTSK